jgi:hypothetical protein
MMSKKLHIDESFYLCEGIWLDVDKKILIDQKDPGKVLDINKLEDQVLIFEREMTEWLYAPMIKLMSDDLENKSTYLPFKNATYILFGLFAYIEKLERYRQGITNKKNPAYILSTGFRRIFNRHGSEATKKILERTRHSLMHMGMVGDKVLLNYGAEEDVEYIGSNTKIKCIIINPHSALNTIAKDFDEYVDAFRNKSANEELVDSFTKVFANVYKDEIDLIGNKS